MARFAYDRRSSAGEPSMQPAGAAVFPGRLRRRAFDLVAPSRGRGIEAEAGLSNRAIDELLSAALVAIELAAAPTLDEVMDMAARAGIAGTAHEVLGQSAVAAMIAERFTVQPVDARACRGYYDLNLDQFRTPDLYEGREILLGCDLADPIARAEAYGRAERVIAMLLFNRQVFKDLLVYSAAASRHHGGRVGPVAEGAWRSEVAEAFFGLEVGEIFPLPVPSSHGFHVLMMESVRPGTLRSFPQVEREIARLLNRRSRLSAARRHLDGLLPRA